MRRLVTAFTTSLTLAASLMAGPFDGTYAFNKTITVNPTATGGDLAAQNNFPLLVRFRSTSVETGSDVLAGSLNNGIDIRFTDESGETALAFERESWSATAADFWVRIPVMNGTTGGGAPVATKIRVYYGNAGADEASNSSAVFDTAANFTVVYHMNAENATDNEVDATQNRLDAVAFGAPAPQPGAAGSARRLTTADVVGQDIPHFIVAGSQTNFGLHMRDANNGIAVGIVGLALKTTDGGATWEARKTGARASAANPGNSTKNISLNAVTCAPNNADICYAVGGGGIVHENHATRYIAKSTDGGETWAKDDSSNSSNTYFGVSCNSSSSCVAVGGSFGGTRYQATLSAEGGAWTANNVNNYGHLNAVSCAVGGNACIAVGGNSATNAKIVKYTNTDGAWDTTTQTPAVDNQRLNGIHCLNANSCIAVGNGGVIQRTTDGGATWTQVTSNTTQNLRSVHCAGDASACIAVGTAFPWTDGNTSAIVKSTDGGATWTSKSVAAFGDSLWSVKVTGANVVIVGANGTVLRSTNAGDTWTLNANSRKLAPATNGSYDYATTQTGSGTGDNYALSYWANVNPGTAGAGQQTAFGKGDYHWISQSTSGNAWNVAERNFRNDWANPTYSAGPMGNTTWNNADGATITEGWHHVAGTRHNTANAETLFVDGGSKCGGTQTAINSSYETATVLTTGRQGYMSAVAIGRATDLYRRQWTRGELDELRFYNTNRSADWFCLSYQTQTPNLDNYYAKVSMSPATSLSRAARNGSNVFQFTGAGQYAFGIPAGVAEAAELRIVDVAGRTVWSTSVRMNGQAQTISWNGVAANGSKATAGVYFARLRVMNQGKVTEHALRGSLTH